MKFLVSFINKLHACLIFVILHLILRKSKFRANFLFSEQHIAVEIKKNSENNISLYNFTQVMLLISYQLSSCE